MKCPMVYPAALTAKTILPFAFIFVVSEHIAATSTRRRFGGADLTRIEL